MEDKYIIKKIIDSIILDKSITIEEIEDPDIKEFAKIAKNGITQCFKDKNMIPFKECAPKLYQRWIDLYLAKKVDMYDYKHIFMKYSAWIIVMVKYGRRDWDRLLNNHNAYIRGILNALKNSIVDYSLTKEQYEMMIKLYDKYVGSYYVFFESKEWYYYICNAIIEKKNYYLFKKFAHEVIMHSHKCLLVPEFEHCHEYLLENHKNLVLCKMYHAKKDNSLIKFSPVLENAYHNYCT